MCDLQNAAAHAQDLLARFFDIRTDRRADFSHAAGEARGNVGVGRAFAHHQLVSRHALQNVADQLAAVRVNQLVFFFDADVKAGVVHGVPLWEPFGRGAI